MPKLIESIMTETAKTKFRSFNVALPSVVSGVPSNTGQFLVQGRSSSTGVAPAKVATTATLPGVKLGIPTVSVRAVGVPQPVPPALFKAASSDKADVDFQAQVSNEFANYIASICHAIVVAHDAWRAGAHFQGVAIKGVTASGGSVTGPSLSPLIVANAGAAQALWGNAAAFTRAIADGLASCWTDWQLTVRVPNLPWYPSFAAFPSPMAPPTPNVATPLSALTWSSSPLAADSIKSAIAGKLSQPGPFADQTFQSVAAGFSTAFQMWVPTQNVTNVLGTGPVPNFAPPYVPVAPVIAGSIVEAGSHFST